MEPFLSFLIDEHPAGWSCILGADFSLPAGYITSKSHKQHPNGTPDYTQALPYGPRRYCHGGRHEDPNRLDLAAAADLPWTYEFSTGNVMRVHRGQMKRKLQCVAEVDLLDSEPDWKAIECGQQLERCVHVASYHFPELAGTPMGSLAVATLFGSGR